MNSSTDQYGFAVRAVRRCDPMNASQVRGKSKQRSPDLQISRFFFELHKKYVNAHVKPIPSFYYECLRHNASRSPALEGQATTALRRHALSPTAPAVEVNTSDACFARPHQVSCFRSRLHTYMRHAIGRDDSLAAVTSYGFRDNQGATMMCWEYHPLLLMVRSGQPTRAECAGYCYARWVSTCVQQAQSLKETDVELDVLNTWPSFECATSSAGLTILARVAATDKCQSLILFFWP